MKYGLHTFQIKIFLPLSLTSHFVSVKIKQAVLAIAIPMPCYSLAFLYIGSLFPMLFYVDQHVNPWPTIFNQWPKAKKGSFYIDPNSQCAKLKKMVRKIRSEKSDPKSGQKYPVRKSGLKFWSEISGLKSGPKIRFEILSEIWSENLVRNIRSGISGLKSGPKYPV